MKIALVTLDYPPARGGVARYLSNLVAASDGSIDVFVPEEWKMENGEWKIKGPWPWRGLVGFIRSLKRRGYDYVLVSHALPVGTAAWLSRLLGGPGYVVLMHGLDLRQACRSRRKSWLLRRILKKAHKVIANSQFVAKEIKSFEPAVNPTVITPGVEPIAFPDRESSRVALSVKMEDFIILSVARLVPRKGMDQLINSLANFRTNVRLIILGDGPDRQRLSDLARPLGNRVTFVTSASDEERNRWYAASDLFVLLARDEGDDVEGFGIVCLEAALAGLPALIGRSGGTTETVIDQKTGLLVDPADQVQITTAIRRMVDNPEERKQFGEQGHARAQAEFRWPDRWQLLKSVL